MSEISQSLQSAAGTILAVLAPAASRIARVAVRFREDADSASTDGNLVIRMPREFAGAAIPDDAPVTLGLLAHELGHWVQPLDAITEIARSRGAPHWLANIAMDIHGESFVQSAFPALRGPLAATRKAVKQTMLARYRRDLADAVARRDFPEMALQAALIARFGWPARAWTPPQRGELRAPDRIHNFLLAMERFLANHTPPDELPAAFANLLDDFPELTRPEGQQGQGAGSREQGESGDGSQEMEGAQGDDAGDDDSSNASGKTSDDDATGDEQSSGTGDGEGDPNDGDAAGQPAPGAGLGESDHDALPAYAEIDADELGRILRQEMQATARGYTPVTEDELRTCSLRPSAPDPQAVRLARTLQPRFQSPRGSLEVAAPGRLDRLDMARGAAIPLRMALPGREAPAPQLILAIDLSASMFIGRGHKARQARIAAQAVALAVKAAGGQVVVILFNSHGYVAAEEDDRLAFLSFSDMHSGFRGGTSFAFLDRAWRRWPQHQVLVLTDGDGYMPHALPADRERTAVLLIDSVLDVSPIAARAVPLASLDKLATVFALLIPDRRL